MTFALVPAMVARSWWEHRSEKTMIKILVVRHTERLDSVNGKGGKDALSPHGAEQIWAMAYKLKALGLVLGYFFYSGLVRARQALRAIMAALDLDPALPFSTNTAFDFSATLTKHLGNAAGFYAECDRIKAAVGGRKLTVANALEHSDYARDGRELVTRALLDMANVVMDEGENALVVSHAPWAELAAVDPGTMPYGIGEGDGVLYTIEGGVLVDSILVEAPIRGGSHT